MARENGGRTLRRSVCLRNCVWVGRAPPPEGPSTLRCLQPANTQWENVLHWMCTLASLDAVLSRYSRKIAVPPIAAPPNAPLAPSALHAQHKIKDEEIAGHNSSDSRGGYWVWGSV